MLPRLQKFLNWLDSLLPKAPPPLSQAQVDRLIWAYRLSKQSAQ
jgi:hypothetical protein